jgi:hypothetical protein
VWTFASGYPMCGANGSLLTGSDSITARAGMFQCTFPDGPASSAVAVKVFDGTANSNEATSVVTINNVAPTIAISGNANVDEGSTYTLTLGAVTDPGTDTVSSYVVTWGDGTDSTYASNGDKTHVYADGPNDYAVTVDLTDEDGTFADAANALDVHVRNVAPTVNGVTITDGSAVACVAGNAASLSFNFSDPGAIDDPWSYDIDWGDGSAHTTGNVSTQGDAGLFSHTYAAGTYTPSVRVMDKDGATGTGSASSGAVSFLYDTSGVLQPVNNTQAHQDPSIFKYGSTIPVKIQVTDCDGVPVSGLSPKIGVKKVSSSTPGGTDETTTSTSGADTGTTMRWSDPLYIYNLATRTLSDSSATYQIIITGPFADVIAQFGTKAK